MEWYLASGDKLYLAVLPVDFEAWNESRIVEI